MFDSNEIVLDVDFLFLDIDFLSLSYCILHQMSIILLAALFNFGRQLFTCVLVNSSRDNEGLRSRS